MGPWPSQFATLVKTTNPERACRYLFRTLCVELSSFVDMTTVLNTCHVLNRMCRGIVTADVLAKGLSRRAIATRKLKGVNWDKVHDRFYTSSAPYDEGKSLRLVVIGIMYVSLTRKQNCLT